MSHWTRLVVALFGDEWLHLIAPIRTTMRRAGGDMAYMLHVFTPETWLSFRRAGARITGFVPRYQRASEGVREGDILLCYLTGLSRWCGMLEVESGVYEDDSPIYADPDPYSFRFKVKPIVMLDLEFAVPIRSRKVWSSLSITRNHDINGSRWTGFFRTSLNRFTKPDHEFLSSLLRRQEKEMVRYAFSKRDEKRLRSILHSTVSNHQGGEWENDNPTDELPKSLPSAREESLTMQANVALVGARMGCGVWLPRNDRRSVEEKLPNDVQGASQDSLPIRYSDLANKTIEQIDVLWIQGHSVVRAFEIEHTTAIYSGLLRMADLLALLPNINIPLHIVAPSERRKQVLREINRPAFSNVGGIPLRNQCSYLSYDSVNELIETPHLQYMDSAVVERFAEDAAPVHL